MPQSHQQQDSQNQPGGGQSLQSQLAEARENSQIGNFLGGSVQSRRGSVAQSHVNQNFEAARGGLSGLIIGSTPQQVISGGLGR